MTKVFGTLLIFILPGCASLIGFPRLESEHMPALVEALKESQASGCLWAGARGGGGGGAITPVPVVPAGGYGSGEILFGRVNSPNTKLTVENGKCVIERGEQTEGPTIP